MQSAASFVGEDVYRAAFSSTPKLRSSVLLAINSRTRIHQPCGSGMKIWCNDATIARHRDIKSSGVFLQLLFAADASLISSLSAEDLTMLLS